MHLHVALQCVSPVPLQAEFTCAPGELVALVGPSGSGKTTLLRAIAGLYQSPSLRGVVRWDAIAGGSDPSNPASASADPAHPAQTATQTTHTQTTWFDSARGISLAPQARRVGLVFQQYALFPHLNAIENVAACANIHWPTAVKHAQSMALLAHMGLADLAQRLPHQLSGGQQQRVALARALVRIVPLPAAMQALAPPAASPAPGVLLLDEPFSAVDAPMRQALYRALAQLHASAQLPIILVTHDLAEARRLADKVVILDGGTTLQSGPPERVLRSPRNARVAQLVGIHNHFAGQFYTAPAPSLYVPEAAVRQGPAALGQPSAASARQRQNRQQHRGDLGDGGRFGPGAGSRRCRASHPGDVQRRRARQSADLPFGRNAAFGRNLRVQTGSDGAPDGDSVVLNLSTAVLRSLHASVGAELLLVCPCKPCTSCRCVKSVPTQDGIHSLKQSFCYIIYSCWCNILKG